MTTSHRQALPSQMLEQMLTNRQIVLERPSAQGQVQPASLDLRLGTRAYRVRSSFLPGRDKTVSQCIGELAMHEFDLQSGAVLERGCVYIVPLLESLDLPEQLAAAGNPKSSTGRIDVFTRLITDYGYEFDQVPAGYSGPLYAEISPRTFSVLVRTGSRLLQLRVRTLGESGGADFHQQLQEQYRLVDTSLTAQDYQNGVPVSVDTRGEHNNGLIGYRAKRHAGLIDVDQVGACAVEKYWEPLYANAGSTLVLDPGEFYILASKEAVHVPTDYAAEMIAYDTLVGEFRVHYAGFFDPGFGAPEAGGAGSKAVLEVRSFEVPFLLEHGQRVGRLVYESLKESPQSVYGADLSSNYQSQGLKLSKHFQA